MAWLPAAVCRKLRTARAATVCTTSCRPATLGILHPSGQPGGIPAANATWEPVASSPSVPVHMLAEQEPNIVVYWIRLIYIPLIWVTVLFMLLHNLLDLVKKTRYPEPRLRRPPEHCAIKERMSMPFRVTHVIAAVSFMVLVFSGFALKYPESWWAELVQIGGAEFRGLIHRIAAVGLMGACFFHFAHIAISARARHQIAAILPGLADFKEFSHRIGYNIGRRAEPPAPVRIGYVEKIEYWAALWGTAITAITGLSVVVRELHAGLVAGLGAGGRHCAAFPRGDSGYSGNPYLALLLCHLRSSGVSDGYGLADG